MKKILFLCLFMIAIMVPSKVLALNEVNIYFFYDENCDLCSQEKVYFQALKERYPNMKVYSYDISSSTNKELMDSAKSMYHVERTGVPFTVIGDSPYMGFSQGLKALFQRRVYEYSTKEYQNELGKKLNISYRTDLEGEAKEYTDNADYKIEEVSGIEHPPMKSETLENKYKVSINLILLGIDLGLLFLVVSLFEKRRKK